MGLAVQGRTGFWQGSRKTSEVADLLAKGGLFAAHTHSFKKTAAETGTKMKELLTKVTHDLGLACESLKMAKEKATAVERLVILDITWRTKSVLQDANSLLKALKADAEGAVEPKA